VVKTPGFEMSADQRRLAVKNLIHPWLTISRLILRLLWPPLRSSDFRVLRVARGEQLRGFVAAFVDCLQIHFILN